MKYAEQGQSAGGGHRPSAAAAEARLSRRKLSPEEINRLELAAYKGPIHLIHSHAAMVDAVRELRKERVLGFDTETRPAFTKGESHPPALLQLASRNAVYVFQLHQIGLPRELAELLADPGIAKAGVAIGHDLKELRKLTPFEPGGFVELDAWAARNGIPHRGLRGLAAVLLGCRISKGAKLSNWARPDLPRSALMYAATDAWIGLLIYEAMREQECRQASVAAGKRGGVRRGVRALFRNAVSLIKTSISRRARQGRRAAP